MKTTKARKLTPFEERERDIRHTLTTSIIQKLQRMSTLELRETGLVAGHLHHSLRFAREWDL